jgi:GNAT superfamily N-acetyltransferase
MKITNSNLDDIEKIFELYDAGTAYQKVNAPRHWKGFEKKLIEAEIAEKRHWKILENDEIACTFATTFNDAVIWGERDQEASLYIHRIATNPDFRGRAYVHHIVHWAREYAANSGRQYIRMDTGSGNQKLNDYYTSHGFEYKGITSLGETPELPEHYQNASFSLFEIAL